MTAHSSLTWFLPAMLLGAAALLGSMWFVLRRRGAVAEASCGRCGYLVVGLTGPICPECGSNLSEVGIRVPGDARPMPRVLRALLFTLICLAVVSLILPVLAPILPRWYSGASSVEMAYPRSRNYHSVTAIASGDGWSPVVKFDHVDLTLVPRESESRSLRIDIRPRETASTVDITSDDEQSITVRDIRDLTPQVVLTWMKLFAGPDSPELRDEAESISVETIKLASSEMQVQRTTPDRTPFSSLNFRQWPSTSVMSWRVIVPLIALGLAIWIIGLALVLRRRPSARPEITHA